jgi:hypothetical protein
VTSAAAFARHGTRVEDTEALLESLRAAADATTESIAVTGRAGDLVLAHHLLLHGLGPHAGPLIRYMVFFRLSHAEHWALGDQTLVDPWAGWRAGADDATLG